jgi:hypothetical protein
VLHLAAGPLLTTAMRRFTFDASSVAGDKVLAVTD